MSTDVPDGPGLRAVASPRMPEVAGISYERSGSGSPLVLVHGIGSRREVWRPVLEALSEHHDVITLDLPGFGASPMPTPGTPPGVPSLCDLLEAFFSALEIEKPHVAGNSLGGWIVLELARRGAVASATALDPGGFIHGVENLYTYPLLILQRLGAKATRPLAPRLFRSELGRKLGWSGVVAHPERMTPEDAVLGVEGLADAPWFWPTLRHLVGPGFQGGDAIEVPVTIAWGSRDRLLRPRLAATALERIPSARFVSLPDCGHVPTYDDPERVTATILETTGLQAPAHRVL